MDIIVFIAMGLLCVAAVIRILVKMHRNEKIEITPVGIINDLPESITGVNKYNDAIQVEEKNKDD